MTPFIFTTESGAWTLIGWLAAFAYVLAIAWMTCVAIYLVRNSRVQTKGRGEDV